MAGKSQRRAAAMRRVFFENSRIFAPFFGLTAYTFVGDAKVVPHASHLGAFPGSRSGARRGACPRFSRVFLSSAALCLFFPPWRRVRERRTWDHDTAAQ